MATADGAGRTVVQSPGRRGHRLQRAWVGSSGFRDRFEQLRPYFVDHSVLDIGCASGWQDPDWFHGLIESVSAETVGIDVDADAVASMRAAGHDVVLADAQSVDLGRTFDVVHAGELIEHLDNPSGFLAGVRRHMRPDSVLLLTTPNAFRFTNFLYRLGTSRAKVNRDHTCWYCEDTLTWLLERNGFSVVESRYLHHTTPGRLRSVASRAARALLPERLAWNTIFVAARPVA
jgi:2-polyprenyl-3-methyl-5-hydroxy-6-metoxy-1,4-benzoquinol methylase